MAVIDPRVDAYIEKAAPFAQPILKRVRQLVHTACPDVKETIKWGFPHFDHQGMMFSIAAFKQHCAMSFWKASIMKDPYKIMTPVGETAMGHFGKLTGMESLPSDQILIEYLMEAAKLNEDGVKLPPKPVKRKAAELTVPDYFLSALDTHPEAKKQFDQFSISHRNEYVEWLTEAKREATRDKRLATTLEWLAEGKSRNWKYMK